MREDIIVIAVYLSVAFIVGLVATYFTKADDDATMVTVGVSIFWPLLFMFIVIVGPFALMRKVHVWIVRSWYCKKYGERT